MLEEKEVKEECLYSDSITNFAGSCPGCGKALSPDETRFVKVGGGPMAPRTREVHNLSDR